MIPLPSSFFTKDSSTPLDYSTSPEEGRVYVCLISFKMLEDGIAPHIAIQAYSWQVFLIKTWKAFGRLPFNFIMSASMDYSSSLTSKNMSIVIF